MGFIGYLISLVITGLVIGGLGRLAIPGPNPMSLWLTMGIGIGGSLIGSLLAALVGGGIVIALVFEVAVAAGLVALVSRTGGNRGNRRALR